MQATRIVVFILSYFCKLAVVLGFFFFAMCMHAYMHKAHDQAEA